MCRFLDKKGYRQVIVTCKDQTDSIFSSSNYWSSGENSNNNAWNVNLNNGNVNNNNKNNNNYVRLAFAFCV